MSIYGEHKPIGATARFQEFFQGRRIHRCQREDLADPVRFQRQKVATDAPFGQRVIASFTWTGGRVGKAADAMLNYTV